MLLNHHQAHMIFISIRESSRKEGKKHGSKSCERIEGQTSLLPSGPESEQRSGYGQKVLLWSRHEETRKRKLSWIKNEPTTRLLIHKQYLNVKGDPTTLKITNPSLP